MAETETQAAPPPDRRAAPRAGRGSSGRRVVVRLLVGAALVAGAAWGYRTVRFLAGHATTDDAQVEAHIAPVLPKVPGFVTAVLVDDNQKVEVGQPLVRIDDRELRSRTDNARASLENARASIFVAHASVEVARATAASARAGIAAARVTLKKTSDDVDRLEPLRRKEEVSRQQFDAAVAARDAAAAQVDAALAHAEAAAAQADAAGRQIAVAETQAAQKKAALDEAELQLTWVLVTSPSKGVVARKNVETGQFVQAGQPLLAVVDDSHPWVVANYKETQLKRMRVGQDVEIEVDAYPGRAFAGRIDSLAGATGARFALLPPDNASGNFVKVVQRIPVKIVLTSAPDPEHPLRAGMSVNAVVRLD